ncbi:MAG TPA: 2-C-methyl-D-erythritol 4-phosphate cytidylyltransferase [Candidatus Ozemobacteraceae bacterium]|nr:2-C-methyl-D-erythritol 4-phosphate cytidylyltransferase [Candidatus Ozemobacteraceae bacterium]HQG27640.1 2-C-methyl-D-erythritol 4-phosphate cytidylyltransferase [Candidatus Ozemobacteraceae bacterium]
MTVKLYPVVVAGGSGTRMKSDLPKQFLDIGGKPVLQWSLECFDAVSETVDITVVLPEAWLEEGKRRLSGWRSKHNIRYICGGLRRQDSVEAGVSSIPDEDGWAAVHDGARPAITPEIVRACLEMAVAKGNASCAVPVSDTLVETAGGLVTGAVDRSKMFAMQTPQIFPVNLLREALARARADGVDATDDAGLVRRLGLPVYLAPGSPLNIKVTRPEDLLLLASVLRPPG